MLTGEKYNKLLSEFREKFNQEGFLHDSLLDDLRGIVIRGETYPFKDWLKNAGLDWHPEVSAWAISYPNQEANKLIAVLDLLIKEQTQERYKRQQEEIAVVEDRNLWWKPWDDRYRKEFPAAYLEIGHFTN